MGVERLRNSKVSNILFEKNLFIYKKFVKKNFRHDVELFA